MIIKNDIDGINHLDETIHSFFLGREDRTLFNFAHSHDNEWDWSYTYYLLDRQHVFRYGIGNDRNFWVGGLELGIGPAYFGAADFWSYDNSLRFKMVADTDAVLHNLALLDEFLGFRDSLKKAYGYK